MPASQSKTVNLLQLSLLQLPLVEPQPAGRPPLSLEHPPVEQLILLLNYESTIANSKSKYTKKRGII